MDNPNVDFVAWIRIFRDKASGANELVVYSSYEFISKNKTVF